MSPAATTLLTAVSFVDDDGRRALRLRAGAGRRAGRHRQRRLGRARDAGLRQPLDHAGRRRAARRRRPRRVPHGRDRPVPRPQHDQRALPRLGLARHRRGRVRAASRSPSASATTRAPPCSSPSRRSTSPPRAASSPARRRSSTTTTPRTRPTTAPTTRSSRVFSEGQAAKTFVVDAADARRRPRPRALGRRGLSQRVAARPGVSRRPRRGVHAPPRRQPRLRLPRADGARTATAADVAMRASAAPAPATAERAFRRALGRFATGVTLITAPGRRVARGQRVHVRVARSAARRLLRRAARR